MQMVSKLKERFRVSYRGNAQENHSEIALCTCFKMKTNGARCWQQCVVPGALIPYQ